MKKTTLSEQKPPQDRENPIRVFRDSFVFNTRTGAFFTTSREGAFILQAAWRGLDRKEIETDVMTEFGVTPAVAMSDTERFLMRLDEMALLPQKKSAEK
ncbi:PqqD family protein [Arenibacterium sp. CAU 1754]